VSDATQQRKQEHESYVSDAAANQAALELLGAAKNRLAKFYNPEVYKEPPAEQLSDEDRMEQAYSFVQVRAHGLAAPPPAPEVGSHKKSDTGGVVGLMEMMINDLKKEMQEAEFGEKDGQADYEKLVAESKAKRASDSQAVEEKASALADAEAELHDLNGEHKDRDAEQQAMKQYVSKLHIDCDWNMDNFDSRKEARVQEKGSLAKAKDILSGADMSFVQLASSATPANLLSKTTSNSCAASDEGHRSALQGRMVLLQDFCEDMCKIVGKHPDCSVCNGFIPDLTPGVQTWDELYAQFDKLKLVGRDMIKEWSGDAGKFGR
jgi:hypothetical protein